MVSSPAVTYNISVDISPLSEQSFRLFLQFTFGKVWLLYAQFEIRQKDLKAARQALVSRTHAQYLKATD